MVLEQFVPSGNINANAIREGVVASAEGENGMREAGRLMNPPACLGAVLHGHQHRQNTTDRQEKKGEELLNSALDTGEQTDCLEICSHLECSANYS